jgi:hypothetical protein
MTSPLLLPQGGGLILCLDARRIRLSRLHRPAGPSRQRDECLGRIRSALQAAPSGPHSVTTERDRLAFLLEQLQSVADSVEQTATAWEERGYWVKADQFRQSWSWVASTRDAVGEVVLNGDPAAADELLRRLLIRLIQHDVKPQPDGGLGTWEQATARFSAHRLKTRP